MRAVYLPEALADVMAITKMIDCVASGDVDGALAVIRYDVGPFPLESDYSGTHALYQDVMIPF